MAAPGARHDESVLTILIILSGRSIMYHLLWNTLFSVAGTSIILGDGMLSF